jgi:hypothetical protein
MLAYSLVVILNGKLTHTVPGREMYRIQFIIVSFLYKGAHTRSIMLRKIVLRNTSLPIHNQVNQHHTRSTSCTTRNVAQHD